MIADSKAPLGGRSRPFCAGRALILMAINRLAEAAIVFDRQHRHRSADIVCHQQMTTVRCQRQIDRPGPRRRDLIESG